MNEIRIYQSIEYDDKTLPWIFYWLVVKWLEHTSINVYIQFICSMWIVIKFMRLPIPFSRLGCSERPMKNIVRWTLTIWNVQQWLSQYFQFFEDFTVLINDEAEWKLLMWRNRNWTQYTIVHQISSLTLCNSDIQLHSNSRMAALRENRKSKFDKYPWFIFDGVCLQCYSSNATQSKPYEFTKTCPMSSLKKEFNVKKIIMALTEKKSFP